MIIKNNLRPTLMRTNSRYRGVTEKNKYTNFIGEAVHDLRLLSTVMDANERTGRKGQTHFIKDNFSASVTGDSQEVTCNFPPATTIYGQEEALEKSGEKVSELIYGATWNLYGEASKEQTADGLLLTSSGNFGVSGMGIAIDVEEGDIIYMRMGVKLLSGDGKTFALGSNNINQDQGDFTIYEIPQNNSTIYVDKRLYCLHREPITLNIDVEHIPDSLGTGVQVEIVDVEIKYATESHLTFSPIDTYIKPKVNLLENKLTNIINNM